MPVILDKVNEAFWLDKNNDGTEALLAVLQSYYVNSMEAFAVSAQVNSPKNNASILIEPNQGTNTNSL